MYRSSSGHSPDYIRSLQVACFPKQLTLQFPRKDPGPSACGLLYFQPLTYALYLPTWALLYTQVAPAESMPVWTNGSSPRPTPCFSLGDVSVLTSSCCHPLHLH